MTSFLVGITAVFTLLTSINFGITDFQTSTATCVFNAEDRSFMVDLEVSTGNLAELILQQTEISLDLEKPKDQRVAADFVVEYLEQNFLLIQDGKQLRQNFLKLDVVDDKTHLVFEVEVISANDISLKNTLFLDVYPGQINIVKVNSGASSADYYFNSNNAEQQIAL